MSGVAPLRSFELRCWARAFMLRECMFASFEAAFEPLWLDAERDGLVAQFGVRALQDIIDAAQNNVYRSAEVDE